MLIARGRKEALGIKNTRGAKTLQNVSAKWNTNQEITAHKMIYILVYKIMYSKAEIQATASWVNAIHHWSTELYLYFLYLSCPIHFAVLSKDWPI